MVKQAQIARQSIVIDKWVRPIESFNWRHAQMPKSILIITEPRIKYDRVKFNRMNAREQSQYEERRKETKTTYGYGSEEVFMEIPKIVFDYFRDQGMNVLHLTLN